MMPDLHIVRVNLYIVVEMILELRKSQVSNRDYIAHICSIKRNVSLFITDRERNYAKLETII